MQGIKKMLATWALKRESAQASQQRKVSYYSLQEAKKVGILFEAANTEEIDVVKRYVAKLRQQGKEVKTLVYIDQKQLPAMDESIQEMAFFGRKELNFSLRPVNAIAAEFTKEPFDLLLDLNIRQQMPLFFISLHSLAKCKTGVRNDWNEKIMDVMIDIQQPEGIEELLQQIDTYLQLIRKAS